MCIFSSSSHANSAPNSTAPSAVVPAAPPAAVPVATAPVSNQPCPPQNNTVSLARFLPFRLYSDRSIFNRGYSPSVPSACSSVPGGLGRSATAPNVPISTRVPFVGRGAASSSCRSFASASEYAQLYCV